MIVVWPKNFYNDHMTVKELTSLYSSKGLQQSLFTLVGNTAATGISAISLILISRILGPNSFGEFSVAFAIAMIVIRLVDAGYGAAALKYAGETTSREIIKDVFSSTLRIRIICTVVIWLALLPFAFFFTQLLKLSTTWLFVSAVLLGVGTAYFEFLVTQLQSLQLFSKAILVNAIQAIIKLTLVLVLWFSQIKNVQTFFSLYIAAPFFPFLLSKYLLPDWLELNLTHLNQSITTKLHTMARHTAISFIASGFVDNILILFVQGYLTTYEAGLLGGVSRIALLFSLMSTSLGQVLFPRVSRYKQASDRMAFFWKAIGIAILCFIGYLILIPLSYWLIYFSIGSEYLQGLFVLQIILAAAVLQIASVPFAAFFYSFHRPSYFSITGVIQVVITILGSIIFIPHYGLLAAAWIRLLAQLIIFAITIVFVIQHLLTEQKPSLKI